MMMMIITRWKSSTVIEKRQLVKQKIAWFKEVRTRTTEQRLPYSIQRGDAKLVDSARL